MDDRAPYRRYFQRMMEQYRKRTDLQAYTELLLTLLAIVIFGVFAIRPTFTTIISLYNELQAKEETISVLEEKLSNLSLAQEVYDVELERIALLDDGMPLSPNVDNYIRQIESVAFEQGSSLVNISSENAVLSGELEIEKEAVPEEEVQSEVLQVSTKVATAFSSSIIGDYQSLINTLRETENLRRHISEQRVLIEPPENSGFEALTLTVTGDLLHIK